MMKSTTRFPIFLAGYVLVGAGVLFAMQALGLSAAWLTSTGLILAGCGLIFALSRTQQEA